MNWLDGRASEACFVPGSISRDRRCPDLPPVPFAATLPYRELAVTPTVTEQPELVGAEGALKPRTDDDGGSTVRLATGAHMSPRMATAAAPAPTTPAADTPAAEVLPPPTAPARSPRRGLAATAAVVILVATAFAATV